MKALLTSLLSTVLLLPGPSFGKSVFVELSRARTMGEDYNEGWKAGWAAGWKQVQGDYSLPPFAPFPPFPPFGTDNFMGGYKFGFLSASLTRCLSTKSSISFRDA